MSFSRHEFKKNWNNRDDFPTVQTDEAQVRADMQALHDETKDALNRLADELEAPAGASSIGATDAVLGNTNLQALMNYFAATLRDHTDFGPDNLTAKNVGLLRELADKYGLTDKLAPTVHDALEVLEPLVGPRDQLVKLAPAHIYTEHWWQRRKAAQSFIECSDALPDAHYGQDAWIAYADSTTDPVSVVYADTVEVDLYGRVQLVAPTTLETTIVDLRNDGYLPLRGKYVQRWKAEYRHMGPLYVPEDAEPYNGSYGDYVYLGLSGSLDVYCNIPVREWEGVHSTDRAAYPDAGVQGEYEYRYVGVPLENTTPSVRVDTGFYYGTGTHGAASPNRLTFGFEPQVVIVTSTAEDSAGPVVFIRGAVSCALPAEPGNGYYHSELAQVTWDGKSVSWYAGTVIEQMNILGAEYNYVAIG